MDKQRDFTGVLTDEEFIEFIKQHPEIVKKIVSEYIKENYSKDETKE